MLLGPLVPGLHQVARDINAQHVRSEFRRGYCRRAIATAEIQNLEALRDMPSRWTSASPLSRMLSAMRVKSPFSQSALFGFIGILLLRLLPSLCLYQQSRPSPRLFFMTKGRTQTNA